MLIAKISLRLQRLLDSFLDELIDRETFTTEKAKLMSQKKTLEEQSSALSVGRADWLERFQKWIVTARNAGEIAPSGSLQEKKALAQQVFGSNLVLDRKKPVVLASNRGHSFLKTLKLVEWCAIEGSNL